MIQERIIAEEVIPPAECQ